MIDNSRKILQLHFKLEEQMNAWDMIYIYFHVFNQNLHSCFSWPKPEPGFYKNVFNFSMELRDLSSSAIEVLHSVQPKVCKPGEKFHVPQHFAEWSFIQMLSQQLD